MSISLQVGQVETAKRVFSQADFDRFAALSGDDNPIHVDPEFSAQTKFGRTVAHGMFLYSVACSVLGTRLPGPGTVQLKQELMFPSATYTGEEVSVQVEVTQVRPASKLAELTTSIIRPDGNPGLQGATLVRLPGAAQATMPRRRLPSEQARQVVESQGSPTFKGLEIGQRAETQRSFSHQDLAEYANLTGDTNPIITDANYARQQGLAGQTIPGGLLAGLFSYLLGTRLPGQGTNYLKQKLEFPSPAYADQEISAYVEIARIRPDKQLVNLKTVCANPAGEVVCRGEALVLISDVGHKEVET
jgi:acyl dehydratase